MRTQKVSSDKRKAHDSMYFADLGQETNKENFDANRNSINFLIKINVLKKDWLINYI